MHSLCFTLAILKDSNFILFFFVLYYFQVVSVSKNSKKVIKNIATNLLVFLKTSNAFSLCLVANPV